MRLAWLALPLLGCAGTPAATPDAAPGLGRSTGTAVSASAAGDERALAMAREGRLAEARSLLTRAVGRGDLSPLRTQSAMARLDLIGGHLLRAEALAQLATGIDQVSAAPVAAEVALARGDPGAALQTLNQLEPSERAQPDVALLRAKALAYGGELEAAAEVLGRLSPSASKGPEAQLLSGLVKLALGDLQGGRRSLAAARDAGHRGAARALAALEAAP